MPRQRTLSGRIERERNRRGEYLRRSRNVNTSVDDNLNVALIDTFKSALNAVPANFLSSTCGMMNIRCIFCNALHFEGERTGGDLNKFSLCCHKGKVVVPPLTQNPFFNSLYDGLKSSDRVIKKRSKNYFDKIRSYNSSFAMISSENNKMSKQKYLL